MDEGEGVSASPRSPASASPSKPAPTRPARAERNAGSEGGHWALREVNEVQATAMGVEIRLHTVKAAIVDARTGNFLSRGASIKLQRCDEEEIDNALKRLCKEFAWDGPVGCSVTLAVARNLGVEGTSFTNVGNGVGKVLQNFLPMNPLVTMVHTEAAGYAELSFDNSLRKFLDEDKLVLVCTIGRNLGAVLYHGGHRMRNMGLNRSITKTFAQNLGKLEAKYEDLWMRVSNTNYQVPTPPSMKAKNGNSSSNSSQWPRMGSASSSTREEESWMDWVRLIDSYLIQLSDYVKPDAIILMPTGAYTAGPLVEEMRGSLALKGPEIIPVSSAIGALVKGAAVGALVELRQAEAIETLKRAVGQDTVQLSKLSEGQLRAAFDFFDPDGDGIVRWDALNTDLQTLGSSISPEKLSKMRTSAEGEVTFQEFSVWWSEVINESPVTFITSSEEFREIIAESDRVVLQVGFSFCRPCKRFEPTFEEYAETTEGVKFVRMNGNENEDTIQFCKDDLQVRKTPSFFAFKNGKKLLSWTGANEDVFAENLSRFHTSLEV